MSNSAQADKFSCAPFIKEIGRGKDGARGLPREQAKTLFSAILRGEVSDFELGAVLIALRVKGESHDELIGFCKPLPSTGLMKAIRRIFIPCRRSMPNPGRKTNPLL